MTSGREPSAPTDVAPPETSLAGDEHQDRAATADAMKRGQEGRRRTHAIVRLVGGRELMGEAALQAQSGELRGQLDDDHRISEAAEQDGP